MSLFIGRLHHDATRKDLESLFGKYGSMKRCDVKRGFGFVTFDDEKNAEAAIKDLQDYKLLGLKINIEFTKESSNYKGPNNSHTAGEYKKRRHSPYSHRDRHDRRRRYSRSRSRSRSPHRRRHRSHERSSKHHRRHHDSRSRSPRDYKRDKPSTSSSKHDRSPSPKKSPAKSPLQKENSPAAASPQRQDD